MLSTSKKIGYASVETPLSAIEMLLQLYLLELYINDFGLEPIRASLVVAVAILWDAVTDPIIGMVSDRRKIGKFGKRASFILPGSIGLAISVSLLFNPISGLSQTALMAWLFVSYMTLNTTMTLIAIPHVACVGDYASSDNERNVLLGWRMLFANIGLILSVTLPTVLASPEQTTGNKATTAIFCGFLVLATTAICLRALYNTPLVTGKTSNHVPKKRSFSMVFSALKNRIFLPLLIAFAIAGIARSLNSGLALFYYKITLDLDEKTEISLILLTFILAITISIPIWVLAGKYWDKKNAILVGVFGLALLTMFTYPNFTSGSMTGPIVMAILGGVAVGSILLIESMVVNAIDTDARISGIRQDAAFFGIWKMMAKVSRAAGMAMVGPLLIGTGYEKSLDQQTSITSQHIGDVFGYGVGFLFLVSAGIFCLVPKTKPHTI